MSRVVCGHCHEDEHHKPDCPEMFFGGDRSKPRGVPQGVVPPGPLDPNRKLRLSSESPLSEEMGRIFAGTTEQMIARHLDEARRRTATPVTPEGGEPE